MSKLSNLIGFWNSKSAEVDPVTCTTPKQEPVRIRKWENGQNFANNIEFLKDRSDTFRHRGGNRDFRSMIESVPNSDEQFKRLGKCSTEHLSKLGKSEKRDTTEEFGDTNDKIVVERSSEHDFDADNDGLKMKGKKREEKLEKEMICENMGYLGQKSGKTDSSTLSSAHQSPPVRSLTGSPSSSPSFARTSTSSINTSAGKSKPISPFARFKQLETEHLKSNPRSCSTLTPPMPGISTNLYRNSSMPATPRPTITHTQMDTLGQSQGTGVVRSGSNAKEIILMWVQNTVKEYPIPMKNFSTCWKDGLAFCALIHVFYPDSFDWYALKPENRKYNFTLAFEAAEILADISPLLEVQDMLRFSTPDWRCVFTYVQSFYRRFRGDCGPFKSGRTIPSLTQKALTLRAKDDAGSQETEKKEKQIVELLTTDKIETSINELKVTNKAKNDKNILEVLNNTADQSTDSHNTLQLEVKLATEVSTQSAEPVIDTHVSPLQVGRQEVPL